VTRQRKHKAQTNGHVLTHKTCVYHDPATRLGKIKEMMAESWQLATYGKKRTTN